MATAKPARYTGWGNPSGATSAAEPRGSLRASKTDDNLIAFRTNMEAGHAGAAGRFDRLKEVALAYAFAIKMAGGTIATS